MVDIIVVLLIGIAILAYVGVNYTLLWKTGMHRRIIVASMLYFAIAMLDALFWEEQAYFILLLPGAIPHAIFLSGSALGSGEAWLSDVSFAVMIINNSTFVSAMACQIGRLTFRQRAFAAIPIILVLLPAVAVLCLIALIR